METKLTITIESNETCIECSKHIRSIQDAIVVVENRKTTIYHKKCYDEKH